MSETTPDTGTRSTDRIVHNLQQQPHPHSAEHTVGPSTRSPRPKRNHHRGSNPSRRPPVSEEQRQKSSAAQRAYVATDPRWPEHRRKLAAAPDAKRMTLMENEVALIVRSKPAVVPAFEEAPSQVANIIQRLAAGRSMGLARAH